MLLALERILQPQVAEPGRPQAEPELHISVVFTSVEWTLAALKKAGALASRLGGRITLVVLQVVPYPLPIESPPVLLDWNEKRFRVIANESAVETTVRIYLCRDRLETLTSALGARSIVVLGGRKRWWPTGEARLARQLRQSGHEVILTGTE